MGLIARWFDIQESIGEGVGEAGVAIGRKSAELVCGIASKYPNRVKMTRYHRGFLRGVCNAISAPVPPPPNGGDYDGGQCTGKLYDITAIYRNNSAEKGSCGATMIATAKNVPGAILGMDDIGRQFVKSERGSYSLSVDGRPLNESPSECRQGIVGWSGVRGSFQIVSVVPVDGEDDCGDKEPEFDPDPDIDDEDFRDIVEINNDNSLAITATIDNDYDFGVKVNVGDISISVGTDGVSDDGGTTTTFTPETSLNPGEPGVWITEPPPGVEEDEEVTEVEVDDENVEWVLVEIVQFPKKGKTILMPNSENNTYFAGYFSWVVEDGNSYRLEEMPIRKQYMAFKAPKNLTGYRVFSVNGAKLKVRQYVQIVNREE